MDSQTPVANLPTAESIAAGVAQRIADADAEAHASDVAFAAGRFEEYVDRKFKEAVKEIADEYERTNGSAAAGGDSETRG